MEDDNNKRIRDPFGARKRKLQSINNHQAKMLRAHLCINESSETDEENENKENNETHTTWNKSHEVIINESSLEETIEKTDYVDVTTENKNKKNNEIHKTWSPVEVKQENITHVDIIIEMVSENEIEDSIADLSAELSYLSSVNETKPDLFDELLVPTANTLTAEKEILLVPTIKTPDFSVSASKSTQGSEENKNVLSDEGPFPTTSTSTSDPSSEKMKLFSADSPSGCRASTFGHSFLTGNDDVQTVELSVPTANPSNYNTPRSPNENKKIHIISDEVIVPKTIKSTPGPLTKEVLSEEVVVPTASTSTSDLFSEKETRSSYKSLDPTASTFISEQSLEKDNVLTDELFVPVAGPSNSNTEGKHRKVKKDKYYIDFVSEEEQDFSAGSSDLWSENSETDSVESEVENTDEEENKKENKKKPKKQKKQKKAEEKILIKRRIKIQNKSKFRKSKKDGGKSYVTRSGNPKEEKQMHKNPCEKDKCFRGCYDIPEARREQLFKYYWGLDSLRRRDWIVRSVRQVEVKRKKTKNISSRRQITHEYVINDGEGFKQVCLQFLLKTLDITQKYILYAVNNTIEGMAIKDRRQPNVPIKYSEEAKAHAKRFIESLPAVPSHYSRKHSSRTYLPQEFRNVTNLYRLYCQNCESERLSEKMFTTLFREEYNISFHVPKKDKCEQCVKAENNPDLTLVEKAILQRHLIEKKATYERFKAHQKLNDKNTITVSFDLQKVLNTPHGESMLLYYTRKYAVYNLTFYESNTQNGYCYVWGECDGKRGGNEIASCLFKYLEVLDKRGIKNVLLYCDSCVGQNKNKVVLTALHHFLKTSKNVEVIQVNYLLPGHTYMPVDSMHAVIEREVKKMIVWSPSQWPTLMQSARKRPAPYKVNIMEHSDFLNWEPLVSRAFTQESLKNFSITKIRIATFKKKNCNVIEIKTSMAKEAEQETLTLYKQQLIQKKGRRPKGKQGKNTVVKGKAKKNTQALNEIEEVSQEGPVVLEPLYISRLPLSAAKYKDLMRLCNKMTIPKQFHKEYAEMPFLGGIPDELPETDEEDYTETSL